MTLEAPLPGQAPSEKQLMKESDDFMALFGGGR